MHIGRIDTVGAIAVMVMLLTCTAVQATPSFSFQLDPAGGAVTGAPGTTVGWGYTIENTTAFWLEISSVSAGTFDHGVGDASVFDFPIIGPGATQSVPFVANSSGLFQLTWDASAPAGFANSGDFTLSANFWDADPFLANSSVQNTGSASAPYLAAVAPADASVPEPATLLLTGAGLAVAALKRRRAS